MGRFQHGQTAPLLHSRSGRACYRGKVARGTQKPECLYTEDPSGYTPGYGMSRNGPELDSDDLQESQIRGGRALSARQDTERQAAIAN